MAFYKTSYVIVRNKEDTEDAVANAMYDYVKNRMKQMSETEKEKLYESVQEGKGEAIVYSREMTKEEEERYNLLFEQYVKEGLFPKNNIQEVSGKNDIILKDTVCVDGENRIIFLPDRKLSDEELLEIIEYYHKLDYSLQENAQTKQYKEDLEKEQGEYVQSDEDMSVSQASEIAQKYIQTLFQQTVKFDPENISFETIEGTSDYIMYTICEGNKYSIDIDAKAGQLRDVNCIPDGESEDIYYQNGLLCDESVLVELYSDLYEICDEFLENEKICKVTGVYKVDENQEVYHGNVQYYFILEDGNAYVFRYNIENEVVWNISFMPDYEQYNKTQESEDNKAFNEKKGLTRVVKIFME